MIDFCGMLGNRNSQTAFKAFMVDETEIVQTLKGIDYEYDTTRNQFI